MNIRQNARIALVSLFMVIALAGGHGVIPAAQAAPPVQGGTLSVTDPRPATGTLDAAIPEVTYRFECASGGVASVRVEATSGDLAIDITVQGADGRTIAQGDNVSSAPNVSLVEAFEVPADGTCGVTLARAGNTSGAYEVWLLPGYAELVTLDSFDDPDSPLQLTWEPYASDSMTVATIAQQLQIQVFADNLLGYAMPDEPFDAVDYYVQADFAIQGQPSYAEYGFVLRADGEVDHFYALTFSSDGDWSLYWFDGEWLPVQEWTQHPAIDGSDMNPTAGVWVQGDTFRAYFNGALVGEVTDSAQHAQEGMFGLVAATGVDQFDPLAVYVDDLVITVPAQVRAAGLPFGTLDDAPQPSVTPAGLFGLLSATKTPSDAQPAPTPGSSPATPAAPAGDLSLASWDSGSPQEIVAELRDVGLVPAGGAIALNVPSSYGDTSAAGFSFYPLGQDRTFEDFVLAFDVRLVDTGPASGCGMYFRDNATTSADALVFEDGSFLLGEWDAAGSLLDSSVIDYSDAVRGGQGATNKVVIVANGPDVTMFVNGQLVAVASFTPAGGQLALEMYVEQDEFGSTVQTYCQLNNIWLWEF